MHELNISDVIKKIAIKDLILGPREMEFKGLNLGRLELKESGIGHQNNFYSYSKS